MNSPSPLQEILGELPALRVYNVNNNSVGQGQSASIAAARITGIINQATTAAQTSEVALPSKVRSCFEITNDSLTDLWFNIGAAAGENVGRKLEPMECWRLPSGCTIAAAVYVFGELAGQQYTIVEA